MSATEDKVCMIEAGAKEVPDEKMLEAIKAGHEEIKKLCKFIQEIKSEVGKKKAEYKSFAVPEEMVRFVDELAAEKLKEAVQTDTKKQRDENVTNVDNFVIDEYIKKYGEEEYQNNKSMLSEALYKAEKKAVRTLVKEEGKRVDGRALDEIRPLSCEVGLFNRVHGSALFNRGLTQVLSLVTLGSVSEEQTFDGLDEEVTKRYMHHYNMPSYSVGEARPARGPGRREIGHGALAERALEPVIPSKEEFPYAIRVVSEVLSSNGSTSQGSICASTLALMDAGVPIKAPVAGISTGLFTNNGDTSDYVMVTDIQGIEDFFGDMDFKVGGTKKGITAIQVDIKIDGLTYEIIEEAFARTKKAREYILDEIMLKEIDKPRTNLSKYAPKIESIKINPSKIGDVIGAGGKTINKIIEETGVKIDIEDDGTVFVSGVDAKMLDKAITTIKSLTEDVELGKVYMGKVTKILQFGALVEVLPGKEGLLHISQISNERIKKVEDVLKVGDDILVKVTEIGKDDGKFSLTAKDLMKV